MYTFFVKSLCRRFYFSNTPEYTAGCLLGLSKGAQGCSSIDTRQLLPLKKTPEERVFGRFLVFLLARARRNSFLRLATAEAELLTDRRREPARLLASKCLQTPGPHGLSRVAFRNHLVHRKPPCRCKQGRIHRKMPSQQKIWPKTLRGKLIFHKQFAGHCDQSCFPNRQARYINRVF